MKATVISRRSWTTSVSAADQEARFREHERGQLVDAVPFAAAIFLTLVVIGFLRHLFQVYPDGPVRPGTHLAAGLVLVSVVGAGRAFAGKIRPGVLLAILTVGVLSVLTIASVRIGAAGAHSWFSLFLFVMTLSLCCPLSVAQLLGVLGACWTAFLVSIGSSSDPAHTLFFEQTARLFMGSVLALAATVVTARLRRQQFFANLALADEQARTRQLLLNVLPQTIADRLQAGEITIADAFSDVTVLFADIVGFTRYATDRTAGEVVEMLDGLFSQLDELAVKHGLEKIKTIGDCYMVAAGIPEVRGDHAEAVATFALEMVDVVAAYSQAQTSDLGVRIGMHSGPVVAGVIGTQKFTYDLWGDTVNLASRMESHGEPGRVHVSAQTATKLEGRFQLEARGEISVKGKGELETFFLVGRTT